MLGIPLLILLQVRVRIPAIRSVAGMSRTVLRDCPGRVPRQRKTTAMKRIRKEEEELDEEGLAEGGGVAGGCAGELGF